jgi:hypothetical protein
LQRALLLFPSTYTHPIIISFLLTHPPHVIARVVALGRTLTWRAGGRMVVFDHLLPQREEDHTRSEPGSPPDDAVGVSARAHPTHGHKGEGEASAILHNPPWPSCVVAQLRRGPAASWPSCVVAQLRRGPAASWPSCVVAQLRRGPAASWPGQHIRSCLTAVVSCHVAVALP